MDDQEWLDIFNSYQAVMNTRSLEYQEKYFRDKPNVTVWDIDAQDWIESDARYFIGAFAISSCQDVEVCHWMAFILDRLENRFYFFDSGRGPNDDLTWDECSKGALDKLENLVNIPREEWTIFFPPEGAIQSTARNTFCQTISFDFLTHVFAEPDAQGAYDVEGRGWEYVNNPLFENPLGYSGAQVETLKRQIERLNDEIARLDRLNNPFSPRKKVDPRNVERMEQLQRDLEEKQEIVQRVEQRDNQILAHYVDVARDFAQLFNMYPAIARDYLNYFGNRLPVRKIDAMFEYARENAGTFF